MGASPIFVRLAEVGPFASAFWRVALALPLFWLWWQIEKSAKQKAEKRKSDNSAHTLSSLDSLKTTFWPGLFFAGDLFFWHLSILNTSVANATFFATLAPIGVVFGAAFLFREPLTRKILLGVALAIAGAILLLGNSFTNAPGQIIGDLYGVITAFFFAAYFLSVKAARINMPAGKFLFFSTAITALVLLVVAIIAQDALLPESWSGAGHLLSLAIVSQAGGQGLMAYALGHLPAIFSSLVIFLEPLAAAFLGWIVLNETVNMLQAAGAVCIILGIYIARPVKQ